MFGYVYQHNTFYVIPEDEVLEFFEDNNLEDNHSNREILLENFKYFNLLHTIHNIQLPLFIYPDNPIPYQPKLPPRNLTAPFQNLPNLWKEIEHDLFNIFAYTSKTQDVPDLDPTNPLRLGKNYLTYGRIYQDEVWLAIGGRLYPHSLMIGFYLLKPPLFSIQKVQVLKNTFSFLEHWKDCIPELSLIIKDS